MLSGPHLGQQFAGYILQLAPVPLSQKHIQNYQQRTGRAGRRAQAAPVSVTFTRDRNYDQSAFHDAAGYLRRAPRTPFVTWITSGCSAATSSPC